MRPWYAILLAAVAAGVIIFGITQLGTATSSAARTSTEEVAAADGVIQTTVSGSGEVEPGIDDTLNFATSGTLQSVDVKVGQHVKKGQLIATLDPSSAELTLESANASLTSAEDNLTEVEDGTSTGSSSTGGSNSSTGSSSEQTATAASATTVFAAFRKPADTTTSTGTTTTTTSTITGTTTTGTTTTPTTPTGVTTTPTRTVTTPATTRTKTTPTKTTTKPTYTRKPTSTKTQTATKKPTSTKTLTRTAKKSDSTSTSAAKNTTNASAGTTGSTAKTTTTTKPTAAQIQQAEVEVDEAKATVTTDQKAVKDTKLYAPASGMIASLSSDSIGQTVSSGSSASSAASQSSADGSSTDATGSSSSSSGFAELINDKTMTMTVSLSEDDISNVKVGQIATVSITALSGVELAGRVSSISPLGTDSSGVVSYNATITVTQSNSKVFPGMSATAAIVTGQAQGVTVPTDAITGAGSDASVQLVSDGKVTTQAVVVGLKGSSRSQIVSGLKAGQDVRITITLPALGTSTTTSSNSSSSTSGFGGRFGGAGGFGGSGGGAGIRAFFSGGGAG